MEDRRLLREQIISVAIIAVSVVIFGFVLYFMVWGRKDTGAEAEIMPNIVGYSVDDVKGCYSSFFTVETEAEEFSDYKKGVILSQSIASGELYTPGKTVVKIVVSAGVRPAGTTAAPPAETASADAEPVPDEPQTGLESGLFVNNPAMEFEYMAQGEPTSVITIGIDAEDEDMRAALDELYAVLIKRFSEAGFIYADLETGASVEYNADEKFSAASIVKAPYVRAVLGQESDTGKKYEMTEEMLNSPSELINGQPVGTEFTVKELAEATISRSDNTAYKMLYNYVGYDCFNELSEALNIPHRMTDDNYWFRMTARQTAVYFKDIYYFIEQHKNGSLLKTYLAGSEHNDLFADELTEYTVCEKYGYLPQEDVGFYTLGDAAVVYADNPYIIVGYVRGGTSAGTLNVQFFHDTARCADNIHKILHKNG